MLKLPAWLIKQSETYPRRYKIINLNIYIKNRQVNRKMANYFTGLFTLIIAIYQGTYSVYFLLCVTIPQLILVNKVATFFFFFFFGGGGGR